MSKLPLIACLGLSMLLGACSWVAPDREPSLDFRYPRLAMKSPPPPVYEAVPQNSNPIALIWRPGYWSYDGDNYTWVPGKYMHKPSFSAAWSADRWDKHLYGWGFVPGHWE